MEKYHSVIIGGGPAGISCASELGKHGIEKILLLERREDVGGMLRQCIHDGFGVQGFGRSMTGPEMLVEIGKGLTLDSIIVETSAYVISVDYSSRPYRVQYIDSNNRLVFCSSDTVVVATGCRERPFSSLRIPGSRPAGIFSAGSAQYMMNVKNLLPGKSAVILGLGDIAMIMARRLTIEGVKVKMVLGLERTGLVRNYNNCIRDLKIPCREGYSVISVHGRKRLKGVTIAPIGKDGQVNMGYKEYIPCDTLLNAAGLIPEDDLIPEGKKEGVFLCGNVDRIYSLADHVCEAGQYTALEILKFLGKDDGRLELEMSQLEKIMKRDEEHFKESRDYDSLICGSCPKGCELSVRLIKGEYVVSGNRCEEGALYGKGRFKEPEGIFTGTVKVKDDSFALLPVRSNVPVKLSQFRQIAKDISDCRVSIDVENGYMIRENIQVTNILRREEL